MTTPELKTPELPRVASLQNFSETVETLGECLPKLWYSLYQNMIKAGFTEKQSIDLLKIYISRT